MGPAGQPLRTGRQGSHGRGLLIALALTLGVGGLLVFNLAQTASKNPDKVRLGNSVLDLSRQADKYAVKIERTGPRLFQSLLGNTDIWVNHVDGRWAAFRAVPDGQPRNCPVGWDFAAKHFVDPCRDGVTFPADGTGLQHYTVTSQGNQLVVDLRAKSVWPPVPVETTSTVARLPKNR